MIESYSGRPETRESISIYFTSPLLRIRGTHREFGLWYPHSLSSGIYPILPRIPWKDCGFKFLSHLTILANTFSVARIQKREKQTIFCDPFHEKITVYFDTDDRRVLWKMSKSDPEVHMKWTFLRSFHICL